MRREYSAVGPRISQCSAKHFTLLCSNKKPFNAEKLDTGLKLLLIENGDFKKTFVQCYSMNFSGVKLVTRKLQVNIVLQYIDAYIHIRCR